MDPRWQHPFTCIVAGPTGCGKTTFVARLLRNASEMIDPPPERVTWYYGEWQAGYKNIDLPNLHLEEGLPTSFDNDGKRGLVVLDDLMAETDGRVTNQFTKKSHHSNTSVIYLVQNLFSKNKESRTISLNSQYMVIFNNNKNETRLSSQIWPDRCTPVESSLFRRRSPMHRLLLMGIFWSTWNRTRPMTCVCARPYCRTKHTSGSTHRRCLRCAERCESTINGSVVNWLHADYSSGWEIMSGRMKK